MSFQISEVAVSAQDLSANNDNRPTAGYHPSVWGEQFLTYASDSSAIDAKNHQEFEGLKEEVRRMLTSKTNNAFQKLCLIDAVQRVGVAYHFESEIEDELDRLCHGPDDGSELYAVALRFRLLRQQGFEVPCDVFGKFKDDQGKFKTSLVNDVRGMLSLYEAAYLGMRGEDIMDEAMIFSISHLESMATQVSPELADQIRHALNRPLRKGLPRLEARYYINIFSENDSQDKTLLKFAKLDYNMLQAQHRKELSSITEWWKNLDVATKLPYARDRIVECYFWAMGVYFEPKYSLARKIITKVISMTSVLDDTYDAYGTYEELELFTDAIKRWDISTIDMLPEYMKLVYKALLDVYNETKEEISKEGRSFCVAYAIEEMKRQIQAYFVEAKWCSEGYVPTVEEYMQISLVTCAYSMLATNSFLGTSETANKQAFEWASNNPKIIKASTVICRLMDDIVSPKIEQQREHVSSGIECNIKQYGISEEEVIKLFREEIANAWKDMNEEFLKPIAVSMPLLERVLNLSRVIDVIYKEEDGYTDSHKLKEHITVLLVNPIVV